ncbi:MAG: molybdopterin cofactor-binding domain-containing protein [Anaerolineae bacterium]
MGDTNSVAETEGSYGSRTTFATGWAAYELGRKLIAEMTSRVAELWEIDASEIAYKDGVFRAGDRETGFSEVADRLGETGGSLMVSASVTPRRLRARDGVPHRRCRSRPGHGQVDITRCTALQDVGKAITPILSKDGFRAASSRASAGG